MQQSSPIFTQAELLALKRRANCFNTVYLVVCRLFAVFFFYLLVTGGFFAIYSNLPLLSAISVFASFIKACRDKASAKLPHSMSPNFSF